MTNGVFSNCTIIDISPVIDKDIAVFPGDKEYERNIALSFENGDKLALSSINSTLHLGAHTDAPNHYSTEGVGIDKVNLETYLGCCQVITVELNKNERITPEHIKGVNISKTRVLFRTLSFPDPYSWCNDFNALSAELIRFLKKKNVILVGIDTPSVDLAKDKDLEAHTEIYKSKMAILEGIILTHVSDGFYELMALPLSLKNADASPVRAVLLKKGLE